MNSLKVILGIFVLVALANAQGPAEDLVTLANLPQIGALAAQYNYTAAWYSGYLALTPQKQLHYLFLESQNDPATDPLLLWLNGGPGCSSLLGAAYEHGPFVFPDGSEDFEWNEWSWNTNANVIYLEAPACVGYSYLEDAATPFNDTTAAIDNLNALVLWFGKFPNYAGREFFLSGESYGGIYVPTLATQIIWYNQAHSDSPFNLQGIAVGNGVTDWTYDTTPADWDFYWTHALYSPALRQNYTQFCLTNPSGSECEDTLNAISAEVEDINNYAIYNPCYGLNDSENIQGVTNVNYAKFNDLVDFYVGESRIDAPGAAPCIDSKGAYLWYNNATVRTALNILPQITWDWYMCTDRCNYTPLPNASYWAYPIILQAGVRAMFYSGDIDGSVPTLGSIRWIQNLVTQYNLPIVNPMNQWTIAGNLPNEPQVAGFVTDYVNFRFVQVKGAGHMVPQWQRPGAWKMLYAFLNNEILE